MMHGWIKLKEKILQTTEPSSNIPTTSSINGHSSRSVNNGERSSSSVSASPARSPSIVNLVSSDDESVSDNESVASVISSSSSSSPVSPSPLTPKITNNAAVTRKPSLSSIPKSFDTPTTILMEDISDDDILLIDLDKPRSKPIETLAYSTLQDPIVPLATDLQSLPGYSDDELRDIRFLVYTDVETLSSHFQICLSLDRETIRTFDTAEQSSTNCLIKILKLYYLKTFMKSLQVDKRFSSTFGQENKQLRLSLTDSTTARSFPTDWNVNRRQASSTHRHTPKNIFHILQLNPRKTFSSTDHPIITSTTSAQPFQIVQSFERVKDILARTYCPHMYQAIQSGYQFGCKSKLPNTQLLVSNDPQIITVKEMPLSPEIVQPSLPITLRSSSPAPIDQTEAILFPPSPPTPKKQSKRDKSPQPSFSPIVTHTVIDDLGPVIIRESIVVLSRPSFPLPSPPMPDPIIPVTSRKRKLSTTTTTKTMKKPRGRPKKRIVSSSIGLSTPPSVMQPSIAIIPPTPPSTVNRFEDISDSDSDGDPEEDNEVLPFHQPKPTIIQNGLRSNYYKTTNHQESKTTNSKRRRCQSSGSLPPFYRGIFESDDDKDVHLDYQLPYDIYWFGQQQQQQKQQQQQNEKERRSTIEIFPISPALPDHLLSISPISIVENTSKKKKATQPKQKKPVPYKKIQRNQYTEQLQQKLLSSPNTEKSSLCNCKPPDTCDDANCLNKMSFAECSTNCACGPRCSNQKIRKSQWFKHLEVFDTSKYGQGLRTTAMISKGTFLCEYVGEIITEEKFHERMSNIYSKDEHHYTMKLTQNLVIDAYRMGNIARFANHSCSPNCEFQKWSVDGLPRMCMFSSRTIRPGEELTYDYNFQCFNTQSQQPCYCESPKCRGFIGAKQQTTGNPTNTAPTESPALSPHPSIITQRLSQKDRRAVLQSSIFLLRNLRHIRDKYELKKKTEQQKLKQQATVASSSLFFAQNYYHPNRNHHKTSVPILRKAPKLSHKEMFYLFYNHIRRSHFAKTGRIHRELIDDQCYYAQIAQLALVLNEIFDLILNYRCENEITVPSIALRKCPLKRLYPVYYEIIRKPIDLTMMRNKLDQGEYSSFDLFEDDFLLLIQNALHYCGEDSDVAPAVLELKDYFLKTIKSDYAQTLNLFVNMKVEQASLTNITTLEDFITRLHEREVRDGQIREILYDIIYNIDKRAEDESPVNYKIVLSNSFNNHRSNRSTTPVDCIVHCRCGSVQDETSLVQCYACQLWQHVACVSTPDPSRPYYCFECQPLCDNDPLACLKHNVLIETTVSPLQLHDDNHQSYSTLTRDDGFVIRINECYFVPKQDVRNIDPKLTSGQYDILFVERLWFDDYGIGQAAGFYYIRPNETYHEPHRKFFCNEVFRFPSSNDPLPISCFVRPCYVLDLTTYCKGKPISDNSSRVLASDLFICEHRVDKTARTFSRLSRAKYLAVNTKPYCFDTYLERLTVRRDYQPHQKKFQDHLYDNRRRSLNTPIRFVHKSLEEKRTRVNGFIEKIYCRKHHPQLVPDEMIYTSEFVWEPVLRMPNEKNQPRTLILSRGKKFPSPQHSSNCHAGTIRKKRRTISISSDDDCVELLNERDSQKSVKKRSNTRTT